MQKTIIAYFGNIAPSSRMQQQRNEKYNRLKEDPETGEPSGENWSIMDNKEWALCAERAATAHNILKFIGKESNCCMGALNSSDTELNGEDHAFIVLKIDDERVIYDPMNPELITDNEGRIRAFMPTTFAGGQNILDGGKTKVTRKEYSLPPAGTRSTLSDNIKSEKSSIYTADINGQLGVLFDELLDLD